MRPRPLSFAWLKQDVVIGVIIFERPAHQHPIAFEQLQRGGGVLRLAGVG